MWFILDMTLLTCRFVFPSCFPSLRLTGRCVQSFLLYQHTQNSEVGFYIKIMFCCYSFCHAEEIPEDLSVSELLERANSHLSELHSFRSHCSSVHALTLNIYICMYFLCSSFWQWAWTDRRRHRHSQWSWEKRWPLHQPWLQMGKVHWRKGLHSLLHHQPLLWVPLWPLALERYQICLKICFNFEDNFCLVSFHQPLAKSPSSPVDWSPSPPSPASASGPAEALTVTGSRLSLRMGKKK